MKSDHAKCLGKCNVFGDDCNWLIGLTLRKWKGLREGWVEVDDYVEYFHHLFWTFPPCVEAFKYYKPLTQQHQGGVGGSYLRLAPPSDYPVFCARHVATNFAQKFKPVDAMKLLMNAAYAKNEVDFDYWFRLLEAEDRAMDEWTNKMEKEHWTQYIDSG
ncbi:hypothetical protein PIB30_035229 [Stylosanthes scabra]|uniref:Uncharacterized protein n=1 Tax=Stylosanthes scabra TaxID=79078 RepID=A0ABU6TCT2_9FABA|nr:hypothetical protein [Stylosanthes scabra]